MYTCFLTKLDIKGNGQNMKPSSVSSKDTILQKRPLPVPPQDSSVEYVLSDPEDDESGGVYTEIEDEPGTVPPSWFPARKYTRSTSLKRHIESVQDSIATSTLLKREAIPNKPGSPPVTRKPLPPPKLPKPGQQQQPYKSRSEPNVSSIMAPVDFNELKEKLNRRLSKSPETEYLEQDDSEEQTEYEEVQFITDVSPSLLRISILYSYLFYLGCRWNSSSTKTFHFSSKIIVVSFLTIYSVKLYHTMYTLNTST